MTDTIRIIENHGQHLAITADRSPGWYTITHLPTGLSLNNRIACLRCCRHVAAEITSYRVDWSTLTYDNRREWFRAKLPPVLFHKFVLEFAYMGAGCWANCPEEYR